MAFHDDLLQQAFHLVHKERTNPKQASLRRAVSTAYYALFHLLISESIANWSQRELREDLSRAFDHGTMRAASDRICNPSVFPFHGENPVIVDQLRSVAKAFTELQRKRHRADYDGKEPWAKSEALIQVDRAGLAFSDWKAIRQERIAQAYLVSLLVKHRG